jgi:DNA-binding transcriptional LysR family regulator
MLGSQQPHADEHANWRHHIEEGRDLVSAAQQLVDSADALQHQTGRRRTKAVGRVRLSVPVPLFSSKLGTLLDRHEDLSIDLILHDRLRDLIEEGIDLQVCVGQVSDSALISRRIGATTAFLVAAPNYLDGRAEALRSPTTRLHRLSPVGKGRCLVVRWTRRGRLGIRARPISRQ